MKNKVGFRISVLGSVALVVSSTTVVAHADESELADLETRSVQAMEQLESFVEVNSDSVEIEQVDGNIVVSDNEVMSYSGALTLVLGHADSSTLLGKRESKDGKEELHRRVPSPGGGLV